MALHCGAVAGRACSTSIYQSLVDAAPNPESKGAKSNDTSRNGNMFSFLSNENQSALRLTEEDRAAYSARRPDMECCQRLENVMEAALHQPGWLKP